MKKYIVTTTINKPTEATLKFADMPDWHLVVVGDTKTPHDAYRGLSNITYLSPEDQERIDKPLSDAIGWKSIRRRNLGFVHAYREGADIVATVDDDNIPYQNWGAELYVGTNVEVDIYETKCDFFDPISVTEHRNLWHRGFPLQLVSNRCAKLTGRKNVKCLVQAAFWDGDPDVDAVCRITQNPTVKFQNFHPFATSQLTPFNSQNTFIHRDILPYYLMIPHIGRMDDIWGAYMLQQRFTQPDPYIIFTSATVYQARNEHDLTVDMEEEMIGYQCNPRIATEAVYDLVPDRSRDAIDAYFKAFET